MLVVDAGEPDELFAWLEMGVVDFITPPLKAIDLIPRVRRLPEQPRGDQALTRRLKKTLGLKQIIGESPVFRATIDKLPLVAQCDASVLISGETGTGKDLCARVIHYLSSRARHPFVPVNCGAIPAELVENELFGHERGAFTGASHAQPGLIREAGGGTLFLDEIDCLPLLAQVKLLRFLQEKEYRPLGSTKTLQADVRVIAAANTNPEESMRSGKLRQDLYYRLNVISLRLPSLRERPEDIAPLARELAGRSGAKVTEEGIAVLESRAWPGNVRELQNALERAVILAEGEPIGPEHFEGEDALRGEIALPVGASLKDVGRRALRLAEERAIRGALAESRGNKAEAARRLGISYKTLWSKLKEYEMG
jgi:DNA-binding NtrC family response regulator